MCYTLDRTYIGGDFSATTHGGEKTSYFMRSNGWYQTRPAHPPPVIPIMQNYYLNSYVQTLSHLWDANDDQSGGDDHHDYYVSPKNESQFYDSSRDSNVNGPVFDVFCRLDCVVVGGNFSSIGQSEANNVAILNTTTNKWGKISSGPNGPVFAVAGYGSSIYIGGSFSMVNGLNASNFVIYDTIKWDWLTTDLCIKGIIMDIAVSSDGKSIYIAGEFGLCNSTITNFVEISNEFQVIGGGMNGTARTLFVKRDGGVLVGGNFESAGMDEIREWRYAQWSSLDGEISFLGEVHSVVAYADDKKMAVGGNFTSVIDKGRQKGFSYFVILDSGKVTSPAEINGPVFTMLTSVSYYDLALGFIAASLFATSLGWIYLFFSWMCIHSGRKIKNRIKNMDDFVAPSIAPLYVPFICVLLVGALLEIPIVIFSRRQLPGVLDSFFEFQFLSERDQLWIPELHVDILHGFSLSLPIAVLALQVYTYVFHYNAQKPPEGWVAKLSDRYKSRQTLAFVLICFELWLSILLFFYVIPIGYSFGHNGLLIGFIFTILQELTQALLRFNVTVSKRGDVSAFLSLSSTFHLITRLALSSLQCTMPGIRPALALFIPIFSYSIYIFRYAGNLRATKKSENESVDYLSIQVSQERENGFWSKLSRVLFYVRRNSEDNEEWRVVMVLQQFLFRIIDFLYLHGYNPITPPVLLAFTICDYACMRRERNARATTHRHIAVLRSVLFMCVCTSPMAPNLFLGWLSLVELSSLFAAVVFFVTCLGVIVGGIAKFSMMNGGLFAILGFFAYAISWSAQIGSWSAFIPLFSYVLFSVIGLGGLKLVWAKTRK